MSMFKKKLQRAEVKSVVKVDHLERPCMFKLAGTEKKLGVVSMAAKIQPSQ